MNNFVTGFVAQQITNSLISNNKKTLLKRLYYKVLLNIRNRMLTICDPVIEYKIDSHKVLMPFSHNLPIYLSDYKEYAENLVSLVKVLFGILNNLKIINIGANVGDTAVLIKDNMNISILAIEPEAKYFNLLKKNTAGLKNISCKKIYLGDKERHTNMQLEVKDGTAFLVKTQSNKKKIHIRRLDNVLTETKNFSDAKMLIIDTDGYDYLILKGARKYLRDTKPVLFFEYDPKALNKYGDNYGLELIKYLTNLGYKNALFYDNFGKYLLSIDMTKNDVITDLHNYVLDNRKIYFYDVCAFHKSDSALYKKVKENIINKRGD